MTFKLSFLFAFLLLLFTASSSLANQTPTFSNPHTVVRVTALMKRFIISLPANPTTGYEWSIKQYDSTLLSLEKQDYLKPISQIAGASGHARLYFLVNPIAFTAKTEISTPLTLVYARPFAPQDNPKEVTFNITIVPAETK